MPHCSICFITERLGSSGGNSSTLSGLMTRFSKIIQNNCLMRLIVRDLGIVLLTLRNKSWLVLWICTPPPSSPLKMPKFWGHPEILVWCETGWQHSATHSSRDQGHNEHHGEGGGICKGEKIISLSTFYSISDKRDKPSWNCWFIRKETEIQ